MEKKLSKTTLILMLIAALCADVLSFILSIIPIIGQVANPIIMFIFALSFWLWLAIKGLGWQGIVGGGSSMIIEVIPLLQMLPSFTLMVVVFYIKYKIRDKIPLTKVSKLKRAV